MAAPTGRLSACYTGLWIDIANGCRALGAGEDLKTFDVDNKWGRKALERILTDIIGDTDPMPDVKVG